MKVHYMSQSNEWSTPQDLFDSLNVEFGFTLDPCAVRENAKCDRFFTQAEDGLAQDWSKEIVFMNPPYGRLIGKWVAKAFEEAQRGATVVCLIPARTDTRYWHDYVMKGDVRFIRGRLLFSPNGDRSRRAPFPSAIVIFRKGD